MATNGLNSADDADMAESDGQKIVTMMDVLQEQQEFEDDANAVLGASDDKNCTYSKGYVKRQAVYACLTCCPDAKTDKTKRAGLCLACSLNCHENHDLVELYTKRNFRCDCGNPKFNSHPCQFTPDKSDLNYENKYNQNYSGVYCICHRPYPDPEAIEEEEMIQCVICEDWLHEKHLEATVPDNDQYAEMICQDCMEDNDFLHDYSELIINTVDKEVIQSDPDLDVDITSIISKAVTSNSDVKEKEAMNGVTEEKSDTDEKVTDKVEEKVEDKASADANKAETKPEGGDDKASRENQETEKENDAEQSENKELEGAPTAETEETRNVAITEQNKEDAGINNIEQDLENKTIVEPDSNITEEGDKAATETSKVDSETDENKVKENDESQKMEEDRLLQDESEPKENSDEGDNSAANGEESKEDKSASSAPENKNVVSSETNNSTEQQEAGSAENNETSESTPNQEVEFTPNQEVESTPIQEVESTPNQEVESTPNQEVESTPNPEVESTPNQEVSSTESFEKASTNDVEMGAASTSKSDSDKENQVIENNKVNTDHKRKLSAEDSTDKSSIKKAKIEEDMCKRPRGVKRVYKGATFWPSNLRQRLCTCNECIAMYKDLAVLFLIDQDDTVTAYEALGKDNTDGPASQYEKGLQALSSLDRVQQINALTEYNKMRDKLLDFLKSFKDRKEIVKEEDIKAFFAGMKPKREPDGVYFCR